MVDAPFERKAIDYIQENLETPRIIHSNLIEKSRYTLGFSQCKLHEEVGEISNRSTIHVQTPLYIA